MPKIVILWTDAALFALLAAVLLYAWKVARTPSWRATWSRVGHSAPAMCSAVVLSFFVVVGVLDSLHFRPQLPPVADAPAGTPPAVIKRLNAELVKALKSPDVVSKLNNFGFDAVGGTPEQFTAELAKQRKLFERLARQIHFKLE